MIVNLLIESYSNYYWNGRIHVLISWMDIAHIDIQTRQFYFYLTTFVLELKCALNSFSGIWFDQRM